MASITATKKPFAITPGFLAWIGFVGLLLTIGIVAALDVFINGLEVVLPTGEVVQVGNHAVNGGKYWYGRAPLPDLCGLFIGWQGTSGIVTKIALQLTDRPPFLAHFALLPKDTNAFFARWVHELDKWHLCDEIGCGYFPPIRTYASRATRVMCSASA